MSATVPALPSLADRGKAYTTLMDELAARGPAKLQPGEIDLIRHTADALMFGESDAVEVLGRCEAMLDHLVDSGRWIPESVAGLKVTLHGIA